MGPVQRRTHLVPLAHHTMGPGAQWIVLVPSDSGIPPIVHLIWLGSEPPQELLATIERLRLLNPGWEVRLWQEEDLGWLENRSWFDSSPSHAGRADIARYEIILRHGGFYVDTDFDFLRPLGDLGIAFDGLAVVRESQQLVCNAFFAAPAGHPVLERLVQQVGRSIDRDPTAPPQVSSGPVLFTSVLAIWAEETGGTWTEIDRDLVFPYSFDRLERSVGPFSPSVVAVHHWNGARHGRDWLGTGPRTGGTRRSILSRVRVLIRPRARLRSLRVHVERVIWRPNSVALEQGRALTISRTGRPIIFNTSDTYRLGALVVRGECDEPFHRFLASTLSGSDVYVDVGANIGQFVVTAAMALSGYGRVFAFEPNPRVAATLSLNVQMHRNLGARAEVIERRVAVSDSTQSVTLHIPTFHAGRASIRPDAVSDVRGEDLERVEVPCVRLDDELGHLSRIRLLKIDVEGNEPAVLAGATGLIESGRVELIDIESIRRHLGAGISDLCRLLDRWQDMGARLASIDPKGGLVPMEGRASTIVSASDRPHLVIDCRSMTPGGDVPPRISEVP